MPAYVGGLGHSAERAIIKTSLGARIRRRGEQAANAPLSEQRTGPEFTAEGGALLALLSSQGRAPLLGSRVSPLLQVAHGLRAETRPFLDPVGALAAGAAAALPLVSRGQRVRLGPRIEMGEVAQLAQLQVPVGAAMGSCHGGDAVPHRFPVQGMNRPRPGLAQPFRHSRPAPRFASVPRIWPPR